MMEIIAQRKRVVAFDSEHQFGSGPRQNPLPGFVTVTQPGALKEFLRRNLGANFKLLYQPKYEPAQHLDAVMALVTEAEDATLAIEEAANYCSASWMSPRMDYLLRCGRHRGISIIWNSQRPADVARGLTSPSRLYVFRLEETRDQKFCRERGIPEALVASISSLPKREFVTKNPQGEWVVVR
jgi:hypothetical protein